MKMSIFKVIFAKNKAISCREMDQSVRLQDDYFYEQKNGQPIYAIINAKDENEALRVAEDIVREVTEKTFGSDYIM